METTQKISIYPNPASHHLFLTNLLPSNKVRIFDAMGKEILCPINLPSVDISNLKNGMYYLQISNDLFNSIRTEKFIKQ
jgi:hypothetical protein